MLNGRGIHVQALTLDDGAQEPALELARGMGCCKVIPGQAGGLSCNQFPRGQVRPQGIVCKEDLQIGCCWVVVCGVGRVAHIDDESWARVLLQQLDYADGAQEAQRVAPVAAVGRGGGRKARTFRAPSAGGGGGGSGDRGRAWGA